MPQSIGREAAHDSRAVRSVLHLSAPTGDISLADEIGIMGAVLWLCRFVKLQSRYSVAQLNERIGPSLPLRQFVYYTDQDGVPAGFCNWAWLSPAVLDDVLASNRDLKPEEWSCGELPFFTEFIAPFGHTRKIVSALGELPFFKGRNIPALRGDPARKGLRVQYFQF